MKNYIWLISAAVVLLGIVAFIWYPPGDPRPPSCVELGLPPGCDDDPTGRFEDCPCDPECNSGGCAVVAPQLFSTKGTSGLSLVVLLALAGQLVSRRRRG